MQQQATLVMLFVITAPASRMQAERHADCLQLLIERSVLCHQMLCLCSHITATASHESEARLTVHVQSFWGGRTAHLLSTADHASPA